MEHPSGQHRVATDAIEDVVRRLRMLAEWPGPITLCAQGMGGSVNSYHFGKVRLLRDVLVIEGILDVDNLTRLAGVSGSCLTVQDGGYSIADATPREAARLLDAIFRHHLKVRPFPGEGDDYAVGAEW